MELAAVAAVVDVGVGPGKSSWGRAALGVAVSSGLVAVPSVPLRRSAVVKADDAEVLPLADAGVAMVDASGV